MNIQSAIKEAVKKKGGSLLELKEPADAYLVALPRGKAKFVVILACEKELTRQNRTIFRKLTKMGFHTYVLEDLDQVDEILAQTGGKNDEV